ncbi:hypothetical protein [Nocardia cyriacigeorgica]|uniref:hypothetical protein n=1 Tax=Nocardia cyriacigeorgica TaxID=135487 RepID=UPI0013D6EA1D|nr:hypothetical protein [Nocardia cyriacigeorgica]NEW25780.1 hypothetical protein [Nocardia cyriacigeorgica]
MSNKKEIEPTARMLLARMTGFAPEQIHLDLTVGRALGSADEMDALRQDDMTSGG